MRSQQVPVEADNANNLKLLFKNASNKNTIKAPAVEINDPSYAETQRFDILKHLYFR